MSSLHWSEIWKQESLNVSSFHTVFYQDILSHDTSKIQKYLISLFSLTNDPI